MLGTRGRQFRGSVRRRCSDGHARGANQTERHRVLGHANGNRGAPAGHDVRHATCLGKDECQRPRPETFGECSRLLRPVGNDGLQHRLVRDVNDQRIDGRPALRVEDSLHGERVESVCPETVDRFRRERDQAARANDFRSRHKRGHIRVLRVNAQSTGLTAGHVSLTLRALLSTM